MSITITLENGDAAIVVRADGSLEAALPEQEDEHAELPVASRTVGMMMVVLSVPAGQALLLDFFAKEVSKA